MKTVVAVIMAIALIGCATEIDIDKQTRGTRINKSDAVDISIGDSDRTRRDEHKNMFGSKGLPVITGPIWAAVFVGTQSDPRLEITKAAFVDNIEAAGFILRFTYTVEALLTCGNQSIPIIASGTRAAGMMINVAMKEAVEVAVLETAKLAERAVFSKCPRMQK